MGRAGRGWYLAGRYTLCGYVGHFSQWGPQETAFLRCGCSGIHVLPLHIGAWSAPTTEACDARNVRPEPFNLFLPSLLDTRIEKLFYYPPRLLSLFRVMTSCCQFCVLSPDIFSPGRGMSGGNFLRWEKWCLSSRPKDKKEASWGRFTLFLAHCAFLPVFRPQNGDYGAVRGGREYPTTTGWSSLFRGGFLSLPCWMCPKPIM